MAKKPTSIETITLYIEDDDNSPIVIRPHRSLIDKLIHRCVPRTALLRELRKFKPQKLPIPMQGAFDYPNPIAILDGRDGMPGPVMEVIDLQPKGPDVELDITQISGLSAGKDDGREFRDFYHFSQKLSSSYSEQNRIGFETDEDFQKNIQHVKENMHFIGTNDRDIFPLIHRDWDNKYFFLNSDGAHHLAALFRQCIEQNRTYPLNCEVWELHKLNEAVLKTVCDYYYFLITHETTAYFVKAVYNDMPPLAQNSGYYEAASEAQKILVLDFPKDKALLALAKSDPNAVLIYSEILKHFLADTFSNLSEYYLGLLGSLQQSGTGKGPARRSDA